MAKSNRTRKPATSTTVNKPATPNTEGGPGTGNERMPDAPAPGPATGETTKVVVEGQPLDDPLGARKDKGPRPVGPADVPLQGRMDMPPVSEAQLAAGPPRPEPARQVRANDGPGGAVPDSDVAAFLNKPIKWVKVRALRTVFTGVGAAGVRRRAGDVFMVDDRLFQHSSMELVPDATPEGRKTAQDVINEEHDARLGGTVRRPTGTTPAIADVGDHANE